jgi:hypothetical protein
MKILNLTKKNAEIVISIDELLIFRNSLTEILDLCDESFFKERIEYLTKEEAFDIASILSRLVESLETQSQVLEKNRFIQLLKASGNSLSISVTFQGIIGIRNVLNELCNGVKFDDFYEKIGSGRETIVILLHSLTLEVIQKMLESTPGTLISKKREELSKKLNFKRENLEASSSSRLFRECILTLKSHILLFGLSSLENRKIFSSIQTAFGSTEIQRGAFLKSGSHAVRNYDLLYLTAYLELVLQLEIGDEDLKSYSLKTYDSRGNIPVELQVLQILHKNNEEADLRIRIKLALWDAKEGSERIIIVEDIASSSDVSFFISSIQDFLVELYEKKG